MGRLETGKKKASLFLAVVLASLINLSSAQDELMIGGVGNDVSLVYHVNKVELCPEYLDAPAQFSDIRMEMDPDTDDLYVSGRLNATKPMEQGSKGTMRLFKCMDDSDKTCEKYIDMDIPDFCKHLPETGKSWSQVIASLEDFDPHCPVKPGIYELNEAPFNTKNSNANKAMTGHWQGELIVYSADGTVLSCLKGDVEISTRQGSGRRK